MMGVIGGEQGRAEVVDDRPWPPPLRRRVRAPSRPGRTAHVSRGRSAAREQSLGGGPTPSSSPGPRPAWPAVPPAVVEGGGVSTSTWTKRSPRPRPRTRGTPSHLSGMTVPVWVPAGMGRIHRRRGSRSRRSAQRGQGHGNVHRRRGGPRRSARRRGRARPTRARTAPRWGRPGTRPGRGRPTAASTRRRHRRGCRR